MFIRRLIGSSKDYNSEKQIRCVAIPVPMKTFLGTFIDQ
jgi:hypothetical protein